MELSLPYGGLCVSHGIWRKVLGTLVGIVFSASIGATTVRTLTNEDSTMCAQLRRLAEAVKLSHLTDEQLCTFRFADLPESVTKQFGFTFPRWVPLSVNDATATYSRMAAADGNTHARELDTLEQKARVARDEQHQRAEVADMASQGILSFHKAIISVSGQSLTFAQMDWTRCPLTRPVYAGPLLYTAFRDPELRTPIPSDSSPLFAEIAFWKGNVPVTIDINPANKELGNEMYLTLNVLWWHESDKKREESGVLGGGERCVFGFKN